MSMPPPATPPSHLDRPRLTEAQKRANHVESEQKRRNAIRAGFERLASLLDMAGQGKSEARILEHTVAAIKEQLAIKEEIKRQIEESSGGNAGEKEVEAFYAQAFKESGANNFGIGEVVRRGRVGYRGSASEGREVKREEGM